jgi:Brp/Blh family beta-carotene 15,15'-monooxygenase
MTGRLKATPETWLFLALGSLALLLAQLDALSVSSQALVVVLAIAVALTGLPHGALDPWVAWRAGLWRTPFGFAAFHVAYVALAAGVLALWQLAPGASLALFLAISAWHFGGDWQKELNVWARAVSGLALLALPAWAAPEEVSGIFALLSGEQGRVLAGWLGLAAPWLALAAAASALLALPRSPAAAIELGAVGALALLLPPLVFFLVYFCALHSPRHLRIAAQSADPGQRRRMMGIAAAYTALTLGAAALLWPWLAGGAASTATLESHLIRIVFIGLAALTWPHMIVVMLSERRRGTI